MTLTDQICIFYSPDLLQLTVSPITFKMISAQQSSNNGKN